MIRHASSFRGESPRKSVHPSLQAAVELRARRDAARALGLPQADMDIEGAPTARVALYLNREDEARRIGSPVGDALALRMRAKAREVAWAESEARKMIEDALQEERRRADRRRLGRVGGRREDDPTGEPDWDDVAERRAGL